MALTDITIRAAKPGAKPRRLFDGGGLYLEISPAGGKWWRFRYVFSGKENRLSLGVYPDVALAGYKDKHTGKWVKGARDLRDDLKNLLRDGINPSSERQARKLSGEVNVANSFEAVAREWHTARTDNKWGEEHSSNVLGRLERDIFPWLGAAPIATSHA